MLWCPCQDSVGKVEQRLLLHPALRRQKEVVRSRVVDHLLHPLCLCQRILLSLYLHAAATVVWVSPLFPSSVVSAGPNEETRWFKSMPHFCWDGIIGALSEAEQIHPTSPQAMPQQGTICWKRKLKRIQSFIITKISRIQLKNHMSWDEPGKSQQRWEKTNNRCQHRDESDVGITWQGF